MPRVEKIIHKGSAWWKHGRRKGLMLIAQYFNRMRQGRQNSSDFEPLDLSRPDWSRRKQ
ncbi:hypothetical protein [Thermanaeromonas toyohensis]|uniref:hypothetical protein n=1 Tax=Thermanaeromonas toyohensis TaxID=161154 RepID=UPI0012F51F8B|nr:hypothetical protein [Thermanaeromonas toyohensis]